MRVMRTTLTLDDDILEAARRLAESQHRSLDKVISHLARRGLEASGVRRGFPTFDVPRGASPITLEMVKRAEEDSA